MVLQTNVTPINSKKSKNKSEGHHCEFPGQRCAGWDHPREQGQVPSQAGALSSHVWQRLVSCLYPLLLGEEWCEPWGVIWCVACMNLLPLTCLFSVNWGTLLRHIRITVSHWLIKPLSRAAAVWLHGKALPFALLEPCSGPVHDPPVHSKDFFHCNLERLLKWAVTFPHSVSSGFYFKDQKKKIIKALRIHAFMFVILFSTNYFCLKNWNITRFWSNLHSLLSLGNTIFSILMEWLFLIPIQVFISSLCVQPGS